MKVHRYRFTRLYIEKMNYGDIKISMDVYASSIKQISFFLNGLVTSALDRTEFNLYQGYVGKLMWLSENVRHGLRSINNVVKCLKKEIFSCIINL